MVGLRCCFALPLRLSSRVLSRVDVRPPECASLTLMSAIHRAAVCALIETIFEIHNVCVDE